MGRGSRVDLHKIQESSHLTYLSCYEGTAVTQLFHSLAQAPLDLDLEQLDQSGRKDVVNDTLFPSLKVDPWIFEIPGSASIRGRGHVTQDPPPETQRRRLTLWSGMSACVAIGMVGGAKLAD